MTAVRVEMDKRFLSTPSARRATGIHSPSKLFRDISIHALREEGDGLAAFGLDLRVVISIHALREEGDQWTDRELEALEKFLSTPSARRATSKAPAKHAEDEISIHALREEGDSKLADKIGIIIS